MRFRPSVTASLGRHLVALLVAVSLLAATLSVASAQGRRRKARTINFEEDNIETSYLRPETSQIQVLDGKARKSLIRIRMDFFAEIIRSAEDL